MKRYFPWLMVGALLMVVLTAACGGGEEEPSPTPTVTPTPTPAVPPFSFEGPVGIDLTTYGVFYKQGEQVRLTILVAASEPVTLYYRTAQRYDIVVTDSEDKEVWRWSKDKSFSQELEQVSLQANEWLTFEELWDQRDNDGQPVPLGNYSVTATSTHCDVNYENCDQLSVSATLQIRAS